MSSQRKYNVATVAGTHIRLPIIKAGVVDFATGADWTPAAGDVKVSKNSGVEVNIGTLPTFVNGMWEFVFTAPELLSKTTTVKIVDAATKAIEDQAFVIETYGHASALHPFDLGTASAPQSVDNDTKISLIPTNPALAVDYTAARALKLDNLDAAISTRNDIPPNTVVPLDANLTATVAAQSTMQTKLDDIQGVGFLPGPDSLKSIRDRGDVAWVTGGGGGITDMLNVYPMVPLSIDLANTAIIRLGLMLTNALDDLPSVAEIEPGTISIHRKPIGGAAWVPVIVDIACLESAGLIYFDEVFDAATGYGEGDSLRITFKSQKITVAANDYEIIGAVGRFFYTEMRQTQRGTDGANTTTPLSANLTATVAKQDTAQADLDKLTGLDGVTLATAQGNYAPAKAGDAMSLVDDALTAAKIATDAFGALELSLDAVNEIADGFLDRDMGAGVDTGTQAIRTPRQALRFLRNKWAIVAGTLAVHKEDDLAVSWTSAITTTAGNPVSQSDPADV